MAGDLIPAELNILTSFRWANRNDFDAMTEGAGQRMLYQVHVQAEDWIVTGKIKGEFIAKVSW